MKSASTPPPPHQLLTAHWPAYRLLDTGAGRKLEQWGTHLIQRDEPKAWWKPTLPKSEWQKAVNQLDAKTGVTAGGKEISWTLPLQELQVRLRLTPGSRHVGAFPEMAPQWLWLQQKIRAMKDAKPKVLNLFGYTGIASVMAAAAGAEVVHVDASRPSLDWARENLELNPKTAQSSTVRWMLDDAFAFVQREVRRGNQYAGILLDPPSYGKGPKGQIWKAEEQLHELLTTCKSLLREKDALFILTLYNLSISAYSVHNLLRQVFALPSPAIEIGELSLVDEAAGNVLSLANYGRFAR
jgi:23S rRNA (cytosine1962-C5)-methyltransferase